MLIKRLRKISLMIFNILLISILTANFVFCSKSSYIINELIYHKNNVKKRIVIVATISPLGAIAKEIGGEFVKVFVIVPGNSDPHQFIPSPYHRRLVEKCDIFISVGREPFLKMLGEGGKVRLSWNIWIKHGVYLGPYKNPHYLWLYPPNAKIIAKILYDTLVKIDPVHKGYYFENLRKFNESIDRLSQWVIKLKESLEIHNAKVVLIASHFEPLVRYLNLTILAIVSVTGKEFSISRISNVIRLIEEEGADVIVALITEKFSDEGRIARMLSEHTSVPVVYLWGIPFDSNERYIEFIKNNIVTLLTSISLKKSIYRTNSSISMNTEIITYFFILFAYLVIFLTFYKVTGSERHGGS